MGVTRKTLNNFKLGNYRTDKNNVLIMQGLFSSFNSYMERYLHCLITSKPVS